MSWLFNPCQPCCGFDFEVIVTLNWSNAADLDLYFADDTNSRVTYYGSSAAFAILNHDAHVGCGNGAFAPEIISGRYKSTDGRTLPLNMRAYYNQYSTCNPGGTPNLKTFEIKNWGGVTIYANGIPIESGETVLVANDLFYQGFGTGAIPTFAGGTAVEVKLTP